MRRSASGLVIGLLGCLALVVPEAGAQVGTRAGVSRPSARSPSQRVGLTGGYYTRQGTPLLRPSSMVQQATNPLGMSQRPRFGPGYQPQPIRLGPIGDPYRSAYVTAGSLSLAQLEGVSGFRHATRLDVPLRGWPQVTHLPEAVALPPPEPVDAFHGFFGLEPPPPPSRGEPLTFERMLKSMEGNLQANLAQRVAAARKLFAEATGGLRDLNDEERTRRLREASRALCGVRDLDDTAYVPCMVLAHLSLERQEIMVALHSLITAARRHPEVLHEGLNVAEFFGDYDPATGRSSWLEQQMRTYVTLASDKPSPDTFALEAYCAWAMGDKVRARAALERAMQLIQQNQGSSPNLEKLLMALQFAI